MRIFWIILVAICLVAVAVAQAPLETKSWADARESFTQLTLFDSSESTIFRVGAETFVKSGVKQYWKYTTVMFMVSGTTPNVKLRFHTGWCPKTAAGKADTTAFHFVLMDSLTVTAAGEYSRQISDQLNAAPYFYVTMEKLAGCNADVKLENVWAYRNRY